MPIEFDRATLQLITRTEREHVADLSTIVDALEGIVSAAIWGALADPSSDDERIRSLQKLIDREANRRFSLTDRRYDDRLPWFAVKGGQYITVVVRSPNGLFAGDFDPLDPSDAALQYGLNKWLKFILRRDDHDLYDSLFSVAPIHKLEQRSPLIIELGLALGTVTTSTVVLMYACMKAAATFRRSEAEADIRETEASIKHEELRQAQIKTRMLGRLADAVQDLSFSGSPREIPTEVLAEVARVATYPVAELATSPLIEKVGLSVDLKK